MKEIREIAWKLLIGDGMEKDEENGMWFLQDCVADGDADAILMLAKCCALGLGTEYDAERAEALVSDAAEKGNDEARILMQLIEEWKGKEYVCLQGL